MNLGFFGPKMAVSWRTSAFQKKGPETPIFIVFLGARFLGQVVKKGKFWTPSQKRRKFSLITEKLIFEYFLCFLFFSFFFFFCSFVCFVFFVFSGHLTWPLNPPYLFFVLFLFCFFFLVFCCFFGGFKGQVRWPEGPPHLALNPPLFVFFCLLSFGFLFFFGSFPFFVFNRKTLFSPQKRAFFVFFLSVSLSFSLAFFRLPLFHFLFLCLSVFLFFLPSFLSFFFGFLFVSCFGLFFPFSFFCAFVSWKEQHQNIQLESFSSSILSHFCWFPLFFFLTNSLSLSLPFSWF